MSGESVPLPLFQLLGVPNVRSSVCAAPLPRSSSSSRMADLSRDLPLLAMLTKDLTLRIMEAGARHDLRRGP